MVAARQASKKKPAHLRRLPRDAQGEGPRHRPGRHARPLARPADDRRRRGRGRRLRAEADQRRRRRGPGHGRRRPQAQAGRAGRHPAAQHAAPDRGPRPDHQGRQARQDRPGRDLLLLPHAATAATRPTPRRRRTSTTRCGPARRRCGPTTRWSTRAAGGRSWSTATASSATCASTCSTWCAGCSTWAGRRGSRSAGGILVDKASKANIPDTQTATFDFGDLQGRLAAPHLGRGRRPEVPLGRDPLRRQGHAQGQRQRLRLHARRTAGQAGPRRRGLRAGQVPRGQDREGPGKARRPGHPRPHARLPRGRSTPAASPWPTSRRATSRRRAASWPTCRCSSAAR